MSASRFVHIHVEKIIQETEKALLCQLDGEDACEWIPFSQIADPDDYQVGDTDVSMAVTEWIAKEKGLEVEET